MYFFFNPASRVLRRHRNPCQDGAREAQHMAIKSVDSEKKEPKLLDRIREAARVRHLSLRTEKAYVHWARRYILDWGVPAPSPSRAGHPEGFSRREP
jgi:hypothetical protein